MGEASVSVFLLGFWQSSLACRHLLSTVEWNGDNELMIPPPLELAAYP